MLRTVAIAGCLILTLAASASANTRLKNICRVKGQEENVLRGMGLIVGLNGTGEANDPMTMVAIARAMEIMGSPLSGNGQQANLDELRRMKNVALVMVTATVPATGTRRGDRLDCYVMGLNGKSLVGGRLAFASLQGPNTQDTRVYALCQGQVMVDNADQPMTGVVSGGCQMEADIFTPFEKDGVITLVLDKNHANFQTSAEIAGLISERLAGPQEMGTNEIVVRARDAANIEVLIPQSESKDKVGFLSYILETPIAEPEPEARVVINTRAGTIVISGEVEIGDVIVSHKNVVVEAAVMMDTETFNRIDTDDSSKPKLEQLVAQLNSLKVPTEDVIDIIRGIDRNGKLHGRLIFEY